MVEGVGKFTAFPESLRQARVAGFMVYAKGYLLIVARLMITLGLGGNMGPSRTMDNCAYGVNSFGFWT